MKQQDLADRISEILDAADRAVVGKRLVLRLLLAAVLADGHILIEDVPGVAKTSIARALSQLLGLPFRRVQFTPDILPGDLTGGFIYDPRATEFQFRAGPIFTQFLLADEINRASPKAQSALLEAMQERQVTIEGRTFPLQRPFIVVATQNPIELDGTFPLPEAQLDRFLIRVSVGYPSAPEETEILRQRRERRADDVMLSPLLQEEELIQLQRVLEDVFVDRSIESYIVELVRATRGDSRLSLGASPRASLGLMKFARALAALSGRAFVTPDDVKEAAVPVLAHRLMLRPEHWGGQLSVTDIVRSLLDNIPTPLPAPQ